MKTTSIHSYNELESGMIGKEKTFLLLYKEGSPQSDCAFERLSKLPLEDKYTVFTANVTRVRDIHERLGISTAPSLVEFNRGKVKNITRGCQTEAFYQSTLTGGGFTKYSAPEGKKLKQVTVYTTPTCSWCNTLKTYLREKQVSFREVDVASDSSKAEAMVRKSGQQGVPQTEIEGQMIVGFDKNRINQLLGIQ